MSELMRDSVVFSWQIRQSIARCAEWSKWACLNQIRGIFAGGIAALSSGFESMSESSLFDNLWHSVQPRFPEWNKTLSAVNTFSSTAC
jgi:hypothetical protein